MTEQPTATEAPDLTQRHFLGVTDSGLRIGVAITAAWKLPLKEQTPLPMSALREDFSAISGSEPPDGLFRADGSPLLWPVPPEVYREFHEDDDDEAERAELIDDDDDDW